MRLRVVPAVHSGSNVINIWYARASLGEVSVYDNGFVLNEINPGVRAVPLFETRCVRSPRFRLTQWAAGLRCYNDALV